jgi:hypothetical protein
LAARGREGKKGKDGQRRAMHASLDGETLLAMTGGT